MAQRGGLPLTLHAASFPASCTNRVTCNVPVSTTDAKGQVTNYEYDATHGGVTSVIAPAVNSIRPTSVVGYAAHYGTYKNWNGTISSAVTPVFRRTQESICASAQFCSGTANETRTTFTYENGNSGGKSNVRPTLTTVSAGDGSIASAVQRTYDSLGNVISVNGPIPGTEDIRAPRTMAILA